MGRGRAKAKQTKVARELKYRTFEPDLDQLQRELHGETRSDGASAADEAPSDSLDEAWDPYDDEGPSRGPALP